MKRIGMGMVGAGFVDPHHIDAGRRLGFVDVVAIAGSSDATARAKADVRELHCRGHSGQRQDRRRLDERELLETTRAHVD